MSIALQAKVAELERRVADLERVIGNHFDKLLGHLLTPDVGVVQGTPAKGTLTLPEKRKSA